jgi:hypothetical protein
LLLDEDSKTPYKIRSSQLKKEGCFNRHLEAQDHHHVPHQEDL